ncbi:hypothetical protein M2451_002537 [Dysgonomonas sp. PFB1-18]|uniref:hypothetical protein n=1 Tax=unclassified Dysgonomonas TaxID=2630389 RepID=UPI00247359A7|nr:MULTISPECIES: hypothetical protein [unclassified Dysgonomonas]MDH6308018.1 hypothetical protein [Dysgonomonas sp. PF1-14]MDH6339557.1 hypothetical protein [Dysgonomonas sp. PF1-16]MDH6381208.1 hypothetical protein [Dysgonomonas sp. PFB1-18]MDH6398420.1 hypothetical protein [Dysgonomonas sp. PF1-23]
MKKVILMLCLAALITGCSNDELGTISVFNVNDFINMMDATPDHIKSSFTAGELENESNTLGKTTLKYRLNTKDVSYLVTFYGNENGTVSKIELYGLYGNGYSDGIELYKKEMDKISSANMYQTYRAKYNSKTAGQIDFQDRNEFWDYVIKNDVDTFIYECWWVINEPTMKFDIDGKYSKSSNSILITFEKNIWE